MTQESEVRIARGVLDNLPVLVLESQERDRMVVSVDNLDEEQLKQAEVMVSSFSFEDTGAILSFGEDAQRRMNVHVDSLLREINVGEMGIAGQLSIELAKGVDLLKLGKLKKELSAKWGLAKLPGVGTFFSAIRVFVANFQTFDDLTKEIEVKAEYRKKKLNEEIERLDSLAKEMENRLSEIAVAIYAGDLIIQRARNSFEAFRQEVQSTSDFSRANRLQDFHEQIIAFDNRLLRLKTAFVESLIAGPQIRLTQQAARIEVQNTLATVLFDLPRLKQAVVQLAALYNIQQAQGSSKKGAEASRRIAELAMDTFQETYLTAKRSQGNGLEEVVFAERMANKLIETLDQGEKIDQKNWADRDESGKKVARLKISLVEALYKVGGLSRLEDLNPYKA